MKRNEEYEFINLLFSFLQFNKTNEIRFGFSYLS